MVREEDWFGLCGARGKRWGERTRRVGERVTAGGGLWEASRFENEGGEGG